MKFKAVIFDLDGTLVHTTPEYRYKIVAQTLNDFDTKSTERLIDRFWFESRRDQIIKEHFSLEPDIFWESYKKYEDLEFRKQCIKTYDDVDFLNQLKEKGFLLGIVTGAPKFIAEIEIELIGKGIFDAIIFQGAVGKNPKPHPAGIEECLRMLGITKEEAVFVGNSDEDILAAQNAGVLDVLVERSEHEFPHVTPSAVINSLYELRSIPGIE